MEAAAKSVELLSQRILPDEPHHLSYLPDWRYRTPHGKPARFDEWHNTRLQYLTFVSDADRGVLLTRPDYDMREEIPKPAPREVSALSKAGGEKKKLSLSDYKKKTTGAISASPPEPAIAKRNEAERASPSAAAASGPDAKSNPDSRRVSEARKMDPADSKPRPRDNAAESKYELALKSRCFQSLIAPRLLAKAPTKHPLPPKPPTPEPKKRTADIDDESRPQKRPKPDAGRSFDDRLHPSRDEPPRRKDRDSLPSRDHTPQKDAKTSSSTLPNGRSMLKEAMGTNRNPSPNSRSRGNSVNGVRPNATGSNRDTPNRADRADTSSKTSVPPLLSPLRLDLDEDEDESERRAAKKRREDRREETMEATRPSKLKKPEAPPARKKSPMRLPPLLSPTLPPEVEAELQRRKEDKHKEDRDSPLPVKKVRSEQDDEEREERPQRKSLIVTMKITKRLRQDFRRILALSSRKEKDRTSSADVSQSAQARKRPSSITDGPTESTASKKPRTSDMPGPARLPAPSTPSKKGTAMSRVNSSNSHANTPGVGPNATPSAAGSSERNVDSQGEHPELASLREREQRLSSLGKRLKHDGDEVMKSHHSGGATNGNVRPSESSVKRAHVLGLESFIAFMVSFHTQNRHRLLANKPSNPNGWSSMFPLMEQRRSEMRHYPPLYALLLLLHAVALEETVKCFWTFGDPSTHVAVNQVAKWERARTKALTLLRETMAAIDGPGLGLEVQPWSTVDEVAEACLRVMRRYCADERIDWRPEVNLKG